MVVLMSTDLGGKERRMLHTVSLSNEKYVDVMCNSETGLYYVMQNPDGSMVYDGEGGTLPDAVNEEEVVAFVRSVCPPRYVFHVGDRVKIRYISDCNPHNNKVGIVTMLRAYNYYPNRDYSVVEKRVQGVIAYDDGTTESVGDFYRKGSGLVCPVEKVEELII